MARYFVFRKPVFLTLLLVLCDWFTNAALIRKRNEICLNQCNDPFNNPCGFPVMPCVESESLQTQSTQQEDCLEDHRLSACDNNQYQQQSCDKKENDYTVITKRDQLLSKERLRKRYTNYEIVPDDDDDDDDDDGGGDDENIIMIMNEEENVPVMMENYMIPSECIMPPIPNIGNFKTAQDTNYQECCCNSHALQSCSDKQHQAEEACGGQGSCALALKRYLSRRCDPYIGTPLSCGCDICPLPIIPPVETYKCCSNKDYQQCGAENESLESCCNDQHGINSCSEQQGASTYIMKREFIPTNGDQCGFPCCPNQAVESLNSCCQDEYSEFGCNNSAYESCDNKQNQLCCCDQNEEAYTRVARKKKRSRSFIPSGPLKRRHLKRQCTYTISMLDVGDCKTAGQKEYACSNCKSGETQACCNRQAEEQKTGGCGGSFDLVMKRNLGFPFQNNHRINKLLRRRPLQINMAMEREREGQVADCDNGSTCESFDNQDQVCSNDLYQVEKAALGTNMMRKRSPLNLAMAMEGQERQCEACCDDTQHEECCCQQNELESCECCEDSFAALDAKNPRIWMEKC
ncbi:hypothetical protein G9A89_017117 [Geosiphon pyriformis]|nr:hypothetical protein G9A89_017117 [Geosiphon pyriformis]